MKAILEGWYLKIFSWVVIIDGEKWRYYYDNDRMPHGVEDERNEGNKTR